MMQNFMRDTRAVQKDENYKEVKAWQYEKILNILLDKVRRKGRGLETRESTQRKYPFLLRPSRSLELPSLTKRCARFGQLSLVDPIKACSHDIQKLEGKKVLICDPLLGAYARGHGILQFAGQKRVLNDQRRAIARYEKNLKRTRMQQEALGLPLEKY